VAVGVVVPELLAGDVCAIDTEVPGNTGGGTTARVRAAATTRVRLMFEDRNAYSSATSDEDGTGIL
jgi:hypothetical protein